MSQFGGRTARRITPPAALPAIVPKAKRDTKPSPAQVAAARNVAAAHGLTLVPTAEWAEMQACAEAGRAAEAEAEAVMRRLFG